MKPPNRRRYLMTVHNAITDAVERGDIAKAQLLMTLAPQQYRVAFLLLSWVSRLRKDCPV